MMKQQELKDIITRLEQDPQRLLTVIDTQTYKPIISSWSAQRIAQNYQSVQGFFEQLVKEGSITIAIEERKKHGSSSIAIGDRKTFTLRPKNQTITTEQPPAEPMEISLTEYKNPMPPMQIPLSGAGFGLGLPQLMDLHISAHEKVRLETENKFYKEENERLKTEVADLKEERLKNQFSEAKARGATDMLQGLIPHIGTIVNAFKGGGAVQGLSAPSVASPISQQKEELFEKFAQTSPEMDTFMMAVLHGVFTNLSFYKDLEQILAKHQLIELKD